MNLKNFLKDKLLQIILLSFAIITIEIFLLLYPFGSFIKIYIPVAIFVFYTISLMIEYVIKNRFYKETKNILLELDDKYLITEIMKDANFEEGRILKEILWQIDKSMIDNVNQYKHAQEEYKEYIEMWIHEIKIPIATSKMMIENHKNEIAKNMDGELQKIENYIEQALFYARSNSVEKDYYIKKNCLEEIVNDVIRRNKTFLIGEKIVIETENLDIDVYTDSKWTNFILNQIIQNSIKYRTKTDCPKIVISAKKGKENVVLKVADNGIGIPENEVGRVFEKGFTGTNGRLLNKKSTGIGLYLCKKLCEKLGIGIEIYSALKEGTEVKLIFPNNSYLQNLTEM